MYLNIKVHSFDSGEELGWTRVDIVNTAVPLNYELDWKIYQTKKYSKQIIQNKYYYGLNRD